MHGPEMAKDDIEKLIRSVVVSCQPGVVCLESNTNMSVSPLHSDIHEMELAHKWNAPVVQSDL